MLIFDEDQVVANRGLWSSNLGWQLAMFPTMNPFCMQFAPIQYEIARTPDFHGVKNPDDSQEDALMLASCSRQISLQRFEELVPISCRETPHGPGVWVWYDAVAVDLQIEAEMWRERLWQPSGILDKEGASLRLWICFNRMFPPETEADAKAWQEQQWYEPRVTNTAHGDISTTYHVCSVGWADGPCVFKFRFERDQKYVLVNYEGPVRFDLDVVRAAQVRATEHGV
jgi:hypothetical protein